MEIDILEQKENKVLDRLEIKFNCLYDGESTPKLLQVKNKLVAMLNTKKELLVVDSIQPHFGESKAAGYAKVYDSQDILKEIEPQHIIDKNQEAIAESEEDSQVDESEEVQSEEVEAVEDESVEDVSEEVEAVEVEESAEVEDESVDDESEEVEADDETDSVEDESVEDESVEDESEEVETVDEEESAEEESDDADLEEESEDE